MSLRPDSLAAALAIATVNRWRKEPRTHRRRRTVGHPNRGRVTFERSNDRNKVSFGGTFLPERPSHSGYAAVFSSSGTSL